MKNIAVISPSYLPNIWNSHGRSTFSIAYGLAAKGHNVSVFTFTPKAETFKKQDGQVSIYYVGGVVDPMRKATALPFEDIAIWNERMLPLLLCESFDAIILNGWHGWEAAMKYKKMVGTNIISIIPFLYTFTGWLKPLAQFGLEHEIKQIEADCITGSDILVTHTQKFGNKLASYANREVYVIPNCHLDMSVQPTNVPAKQKNQICFVGKVNREKCLERVIRVLPELPEVKLIIASIEKHIGYINTLASLAKKLDVDHNIRFLDWRSTTDIRELYKESSLAIVPSNFEPYGYSALDPMALGTPVLVSEWSMLSEYLHTDDFTFSQLKMLQEKIASMLTISKEEYAKITADNKAKTISDFSELNITSLLDQVL